MSEVVAEFRILANVSSLTPAFEVFDQYGAYVYDVILAVGRMLSIAVHQKNISGDINRINQFSYEDDTLGS